MLLYISSPAGIKFSNMFFSEIANYALREENEAREVEERGAREREAEKIRFTKVSDDEYAQFFARHQAREAAREAARKIVREVAREAAKEIAKRNSKKK